MTNERGIEMRVATTGGPSARSSHTYTFWFAKRQVSCVCGWSDTMPTESSKAAYSKFERHADEREEDG